MKLWGWIGTIATVAVVLAVLLLVWRSAGSGPGVGPSSVAPSDIGGPFRLVDQSGATVDQGLLRGKWSAVFFGYTYCPDVCPTTLAALGQAVGDLGADARRFQVVFITVDPERDTPAALKAYLASPTFPPGAIGLTGAPRQIAAVAHVYHVYYQKVPQGSSYSMDHSAVVYLMDPQGRFVRPLDVDVAPPQIARQIRAAMNGA
jgi:protein SCO1/2